MSSNRRGPKSCRAGSSDVTVTPHFKVEIYYFNIFNLLLIQLYAPTKIMVVFRIEKKKSQILSLVSPSTIIGEGNFKGV
jgi:hypothetical protein